MTCGQGSDTHQSEPGVLGVVEEGVEVVTVGRTYTGMATGSSLPTATPWLGNMTSPPLQTRMERWAQLSSMFPVTCSCCFNALPIANKNKTNFHSSHGAEKRFWIVVNWDYEIMITALTFYNDDKIKALRTQALFYSLQTGKRELPPTKSGE